MTLHPLHFHGSILQSLHGMGKLRHPEALNPEHFFESVHRVNLDLEAPASVEEARGGFRVTAIGLSRRGGAFAKLFPLEPCRVVSSRARRVAFFPRCMG